jgi:hypothetical protein
MTYDVIVFGLGGMESAAADDPIPPNPNTITS